MARYAGNDPTRLANGNRIVNYTVSKTTNAYMVSIPAAFSQAAKKLGDELPSVFQEMAKALDLNAIPRKLLEDTNLKLAKNAQKTMVNGWRSRLPVRASPYGGPTRLSGRLGEALNDGSMTRNTTARRISFLNGAHLSNVAMHWWRVNYGSRGPNLAGGRHAGSFPVKFPGGNTIAVLHDDAPPTPEHWLPTTYVAYGRGPGSRLFPTAPDAWVRGGGTRAAYFTDLALERLSHEFGPAYYQMFVKYGRSAAGEANFKKRSIEVTGHIRTQRAAG